MNPRLIVVYCDCRKATFSIHHGGVLKVNELPTCSICGSTVGTFETPPEMALGSVARKVDADK